ncbi:MAG: dockerin type I domain-containing protein [Phycisphaerales bacterium]|nr:dockerin type I domain-containing protein [Phycisphaerales bacterium]MCI0674371.1 dockerin type I domain-containing protein [Phycisphaerales bacterium]
MRGIRPLLIGLIVGLAMAPPLGARGGGIAGSDFDLTWNTVDGGGGASSGGTFEASGTIGQPDASGPMTGGDPGNEFELTGGFWPGAGGSEIDTCPADIAPLPDGDGLVNVVDLLAVISNWGAAGGAADVTGDGTVNIADLLAVISAWGVCP